MLDDLAAGKKAKTGPQSKRKGSEPDGPLTALNNLVRRALSRSLTLIRGGILTLGPGHAARSRKMRRRSSPRSGDRWALERANERESERASEFCNV